MPLPLKTQQTTRPQPAPLAITVVFTNPKETESALRAAATLAGGLDASIRVIATRVVPFPLQLTCPQVPVSFTEQQVADVALAAGVEAEVQVFCCRDREETLLRFIPEHSVVVMKCRRHWLPSKQSRLARLLRQKGHEVVLVDAK